MSDMRLQVACAKAGIASRRESAKIIESGRISVNGKIIIEPGYRVDLDKDRISINNKNIALLQRKHYYVLNKPKGVVSTARDERGRKKVIDYVKNKNIRVYPVGRLDKDTTGLIMLTNDGDLSYRLTHPKFNVERVYKVKVKGKVPVEKIKRLIKGINLDGKVAKVKEAYIVESYMNHTELLLVLCEGRKREIRRMMMSLGHIVKELMRISYGPIELGNLKEGEIRAISGVELRKLKTSVGL